MIYGGKMEERAGRVCEKKPNTFPNMVVGLLSVGRVDFVSSGSSSCLMLLVVVLEGEGEFVLARFCGVIDWLANSEMESFPKDFPASQVSNSIIFRNSMIDSRSVRSIGGNSAEERMVSEVRLRSWYLVVFVKKKTSTRLSEDNEPPFRVDREEGGPSFVKTASNMFPSLCS